MINFDNYANENKTKHNKNWPYIPHHPHRILIITASGPGKTNLLLNLMENQPDIDTIYLYAKDPYESKNQYLNNKREGVGINHLMILKLLSNIQTKCMMFTKILNTILTNKILIVLDDMIAKRELPQIAVNHSSDINTKDLVISIENVHMNHILF